MINKNFSKDKGTRAENKVKEILVKYTKLNWQRIPSSGALDAIHQLKGDLYIVNSNNKYAVEVKHYKEDKFTSKILTDKNPQLYIWWEQAIRQAEEVDKEPLLIFKFDRSKVFVMTKELVSTTRSWYNFSLDATICLLEDWLKEDKPEFIV